MLQDKYPTRYLPNVGRQVMQEGGVPTTDDSIVSSVEFAPEPVLPTFAQPETQAVTKALDVANAAPPKEYKPFGVLPFREDESGIHFDPHAGVLGSVISGFTAPGDVVTGKLDPMSDEGVKRALDVAGLAMSGSAFGTRPAGALASGPSRPGIGHNMPPEEMKITPERVTNALGMHSHAAEVARGLPQQSGTIEQMLGMIRPKVNPEEIHWSGVESAFQPGQKVTAEDVAQHFERNLPQVKETVYSENKTPVRSVDEAFDMYWSDEQDLIRAENPELSWREAREDAREQFLDDLEGDEEYAHSYVYGDNTSPKYKEWSTPGGTNYREIVLHHPVGQIENPGTRMITYKYKRFSESKPMPVSPEEIEKMKERGFEIEDHGPGMMDAPTFDKSHHDNPNVIGHLRVSDMKGPNNEKILNVHELQSDWGQKARKHGITTDQDIENIAALKVKKDEIQAAIINEVQKIKQEAAAKLKSTGFEDAQIESMLARTSPGNLAQIARGTGGANEYMGLVIENSRLSKDIENMSQRTPTAPYVTSREGSHNTPGWTDLLIKRVMQEAERGGYDKVVFDTVDEQISRYGGLAETKKGMPEYYGKIVPNRIARVMKHADPNFEMTTHEVGSAKRLEPIKYDKHSIRDALSEMDEQMFSGKEDIDPSMTNLGRYFSKASEFSSPSSQLKLAGLHEDYILHHGKKQGVEPPRMTMNKKDDHFVVKDEESGATWLFANRKEALAAMKTYSADKVIEKIKSGTVMSKRPGFDVTEAVKHVGKNTRAYKYGGDVEDALDIARKVGR